MNKLTSAFAFLIFLFTWITSSAQDTTVRPFPMEERALLWKIEGNGVKTKSYLFGTVHLIDEERFFFPKKLEKIVAKSEVLTMEIAGLPDPKEAMKLSLLEEGKFFDFFSEAQKDSILMWVEQHTDMAPKTFELMVTKMRPFVVAQLLPELDESNPNRGMDNKKSYEVELELIAEDKRLEIQGFETIAEQMNLFNSLTFDEQSEMVMGIIRDTTSAADEEFERIMNLYAEQDLDGLYQAVAGDEAMSETLNDLVLDNRNKRWIPQIEKMIAEKSTFIAVGAGHLGGPNGVIRLLEAQGYTLIPVEL